MLDHRTNTKVKDFLNLTFQNFLIPLINNPTTCRITKANTTLIDHILTNDFSNTACSTGIVKSDISDHFPIFLITSVKFLNNIQYKTTFKKREINEKSKQYFMEILNEVNWKHLYSLTDTTLAYEHFLRTFSGLYNQSFPIKELSLKLKTVFNPWMMKELQKSSKMKTETLHKFLKSKTNENEKNIRPANLYSKFLKKSLKHFITRESSIVVSKI